MNKESILQLSRKENENKPDECTLAAHAAAAKFSSIVGGYIAALLSLLGAFLFDSLALSAGVCTLLFSMGAVEHIVIYKKLKQPRYLIWCISEAVVGISGFISLFLLLR